MELRAVGVVYLLLLSSCAPLRQLEEVEIQVDNAAVILEAELGVRPEIGFNIINEQLSLVTVVFDSDSVRELTVGDLERHVHRALSSTLTRRPVHVQVSVSRQGIRSDLDETDDRP